MTDEPSPASPFPMYAFPTFSESLRETFPEIGTAFRELRRVIRESGPIDAKHRELILLGAFAAARIEGGFRVHCRIALEEGATPDEIYQAVLLTLGAAQGLSPVVEALQWARETIADQT